MFKNTIALFIVIFLLSFAYWHDSYKDYSSSKEKLNVQQVDIFKNPPQNPPCNHGDWKCVNEKFRHITSVYGPTATLRYLEAEIKNNKVDPSIDTHALAHEVGKATADTFGKNIQAFLLCPMEMYNSGCNHGFLEEVISQNLSATEAANKICRNVGTDIDSLKSTSLCFHGIGHGLMMGYDYDLSKALDTCDSLGSFLASSNCWQGVFMEGANAQANNTAVTDNFSSSDPYQPCNVINQKYNEACYMYHPIYLLHFFKGNLRSAVDSCSKSPSTKGREHCAFGFGVIFSDTPWLLSQKASITDVPLEAIKRCNLFHGNLRGKCIHGALVSFINTDYPNLEKRAIHMCNLIGNGLREKCFGLAASQIRFLAGAIDDRLLLCSKLPEKHKDKCYREAVSKRSILSFIGKKISEISVVSTLRRLQGLSITAPPPY